MMGRCAPICLLAIWTLVCGAGGVWGAPFDLIVCGSGGEEGYRARFAGWGGRLRKVLVEDLKHPVENVRLLTESGGGAAGVSSLKNIGAAIERVAQRVTERDDLFVYLIGHGSYRRRTAKLNIPGADLSAGDLETMLKRVGAGRIVVVNAASASAAFINVLSSEGRIVCTSTKSVEERNATRFMDAFIQALEEGSADQNRDGRVSVLEACQQAASLTQAWYTGEGLIATEHALLDDNGDGLGSRLPLVQGSGEGQAVDGALAERCYLKDFQFPPGTSAELIDAYRAALQDVEAFIRQKPEGGGDGYASQLEALLVKAARIHRKIRAGTPKADGG